MKEYKDLLNEMLRFDIIDEVAGPSIRYELGHIEQIRLLDNPKEAAFGLLADAIKSKVEAYEDEILELRRKLITKVN